MALTKIDDRGLNTPIDLLDNEKIRFGTGNDLELYHNGTENVIDSNAGALDIIAANNTKAIRVHTDATVDIGNGADNVQLRFGAGSDLKIYHDGTNSRIHNSTGELIFRTGSNYVFYNSDGTEKHAKFVENGGVELYYDNTLTCYTGNGALQFPDNQAIFFGAGNDLQIYHDGSNNNSYIKETNASGHLYVNGTNIYLSNAANDKDYITCVDAGAVTLKYNNSTKFETTSTGATVSGTIVTDAIDMEDNAKIYLGAGDDLQIYHDGNNSFIKDTGTGRLSIVTSQLQLTNAADSEVMIKATENSAVELYYDNVKKAQTYAEGLEVLGDFWLNNQTNSGKDIWFDESGNLMHWQDSVKATFGDGDDLEIYHNGTNGYIKNTTGTLHAWADNWKVMSVDDNETMLTATEHGAVELYYDNVKKAYTYSNGLACTANLSMVDSGKVVFGSGNDLEIYHDGTRNILYADIAGQYVFKAQNNGNNANRYGIVIDCGTDDAGGTNYAVSMNDGDGDNQGHITFTHGTVTYGTFTAHHPCIVPNADNPSDNSNAYPYGTLLETISIEYTQKNGANTERGIRYKVQKTQSANSKKVLGAYGSSMNGGPDGQTNEHQALILGDGHILCNNAGGNIEVGDGICSSSTAGIGQKATVNPSMIIGIAQEVVNFTGSETKLVAVQYGLQQFIPWT